MLSTYRSVGIVTCAWEWWVSLASVKIDQRAELGEPLERGGLRQRLLDAAFELTYAKGFQATGLSEIISHVGATKGALYHHFCSKTELGYALVDEHIRRFVHESWILPLATDGDGIETIKAAFLDGRDKALAKGMRLEYGCPLSNLAHEMSSVDEGFRVRVDRILCEWREGLEELLAREQKKGRVRRDINAAHTAAFIISSFQGCMARAKITRDPGTMEEGRAALFTYLDLIRTGKDGVST